METILDEPHGLDSLVFATVHEKDFVEFLASNGSIGDTGDWREMLGVLRFNFPDDWAQFKKIAPAEREGADYNNFIAGIAAEMYDVATSEAGVVKETSEEEKGKDLFKPLP
jgi:hypothetical protein